MSLKDPKQVSIADLMNTVGDSLIVARVIRLWWTTNDETPQICEAVELILLDEKNDTIHATINKRLLDIFYHGSVVEGEVYRIARFKIGNSPYSFKANDNKLRIDFKSNTKLTRVATSSIPGNKFNMVEFRDVIHHNVDLHQMIDVVAEVVDYGAIVISKKNIPYLTVILRDARGDNLNCIVWGPFPKIVIEICTQHKYSPDRPVIVMQYVKRWFRHHKDCITTNRGVTRFILNPNLPEAAALYARRAADKKAGLDSRLRRVAPANDIFSNADLKSLAEINATTKAGNFLTVAMFTDLPITNAWYFNSCNSCRSNCVRGYSGEWLCTKLECSKYNIPTKYVTPRYLVIYGVHNSQGDYAEVKLFENHITPFVSKRVAELIGDSRQSPTRAPFPPELLAIMYKDALMKLNVSREHNLNTGSKVYTVLSISFKAEDISKWKSMYKDQKGEAEEIQDGKQEGSATANSGDLELNGEGLQETVSLRHPMYFPDTRTSVLTTSSATTAKDKESWEGMEAMIYSMMESDPKVNLPQPKGNGKEVQATAEVIEAVTSDGLEGTNTYGRQKTGEARLTADTTVSKIAYNSHYQQANGTDVMQGPREVIAPVKARDSKTSRTGITEGSKEASEPVKRRDPKAAETRVGQGVKKLSKPSTPSVAKVSGSTMANAPNGPKLTELIKSTMQAPLEQSGPMGPTSPATYTWGTKKRRSSC